MLLGRIKEAIETRLEVAEKKHVLMAATVLNCEGWEKRDDSGEDVEFADGCVAELYEHFKEPLSKAALNGSLGELLDQWHHLIEYTKQYLEPLKTPYLRVWRRIFDSSRRNEWNMVLILVELLFAIPTLNAKVKRLFSLMNRVKTDARATLSESTLNNLITIRAEGPELQDYDPTPAIELWLSSAHCRPNRKARKNYKTSQGSAKMTKVLIDDSSTEESSAEDGEHSANEGSDKDKENALIAELDELE